MHDVPAHLYLRICFLRGAVDQAVNFLLALEPKLFPSQYLRIFQKQSPVCDKRSVVRPRLAIGLFDPLSKGQVTFARSCDVDSLLGGLLNAMSAKTVDE